MITWLNLIPLFLMPTILVGMLSAIPTFVFNGRTLGGGPFREYLVNHVALTLIPNSWAALLVDWFAGASVLGEWCLAFWLGININAMLLPFIYALGLGFIAVSGWWAKTDMQLKQKSVR